MQKSLITHNEKLQKEAFSAHNIRQTCLKYISCNIFSYLETRSQGAEMRFEIQCIFKSFAIFEG